MLIKTIRVSTDKNFSMYTNLLIKYQNNEDDVTVLPVD